MFAQTRHGLTQYELTAAPPLTLEDMPKTWVSTSFTMCPSLRRDSKVHNNLPSGHLSRIMSPELAPGRHRHSATRSGGLPFAKHITHHPTAEHPPPSYII